MAHKHRLIADNLIKHVVAPVVYHEKADTQTMESLFDTRYYLHEKTYIILYNICFCL